jgi:hypothetical protein
MITPLAAGAAGVVAWVAGAAAGAAAALEAWLAGAVVGWGCDAGEAG